MSSFTFLLVCVQVCLLQNAYSQCIGGAWPGAASPYALAGPLGPAGPLGGPFGLAGPGLAAPLAASFAYGGAGIGEVAVAGELPVGGATLVAGQVPILGAVEFGGVLPAAGAVTITGSCACGCGGYPGPYMY